MDSNLLGTDVETVIDRLLDDANGDLYLVNPTREVLETVVEMTGSRPAAPEIRVVASRGLVRDVMDDFIVASTTADLIEEGRLAIRTAQEIPPESVFITPERVVALVSLGEATAGIATEDSGYVSDTTTELEELWAEAEDYSLRTPAMTRVEETLSDAVGDDVEGDFAAMLSSMETARGNGEGLDEVTVSLLAAAKNQVLLYDISRWGEDADVASKATFSRTKSTLEEKGLIETEKVPIDVGRPRLRLKLADDRLADADADELASVAQSVLAS